MKSYLQSLTHTGEGIVIDIGTGDGNFVSAAARKEPAKFFIGIDANVKPLEVPSRKAARKPAKGGLPNVMFVRAAVEELPEELDDVANEIHIHFPWGSLLKAVATGDNRILGPLRRIAADDCLLEIVIGLDPERDRSELDRLGVPMLTPIVIHSFLVSKYIAAGFELVEARELGWDEWTELKTTWAKKLRFGTGRKVFLMLFRANALCGDHS